MTVELLRSALAWCSVIDIGILLFWFLAFTMAGDWMYRIHGRFFKISRESFTMANYCGLGLFKLAILVFNLVPYLALRILA